MLQRKACKVLNEASLADDSHEGLITLNNSSHLHKHELETYIDSQTSSQPKRFFLMFDIE